MLENGGFNGLSVVFNSPQDLSSQTMLVWEIVDSSILTVTDSLYITVVPESDLDATVSTTVQGTLKGTNVKGPIITVRVSPAVPSPLKIKNQYLYGSSTNTLVSNTLHDLPSITTSVNWQYDVNQQNSITDNEENTNGGAADATNNYRKLSATGSQEIAAIAVAGNCLLK